MKVIRTDTLFDFPIQFKELNHSDFEGFLFEDEEKTIISPNNEGYIAEALAEVIDLEKSDTTVINASVGQGKTTAIIDFIKWYYEQNLYYEGNYKIIIVCVGSPILVQFKNTNFEII